MSKIISILALCVCFFIAVFAFGAKPVDIKFTAAQLDYLETLQLKESGKAKNNGRDAVGDNGKAIGPMQIWRVYWQDSGMPGTYEQCKDLAYARQVVARYAMRYEPKAWKNCDMQVLARLHNGGPGWASKRAKTDKYWRDFQVLFYR